MRNRRRILAATLVLMPSACSVTAAQEGDGSPYLLRVSPLAEDTTGLDLELCAVFDGGERGLGRDWEDVVWFELDGNRIEDHQPRKDYRPDPPEVGACTASLRQLLHGRDTVSLPEPGPVQAAVVYRDNAGIEHRHEWETNFDLAAPEAPEHVQRIRRLYDPLRDIDRGRASADVRIAGYYLEGDVLNVYLHADANAEAMRAEIEASLGEEIPDGGLRILQPESPPGEEELNAWVGEAQGPVWGAEDVRLHGATGGCCVGDHFLIMVGTLYSAHRIREVIAQTSLPQEVVHVSVPPKQTLEEESGPAYGIRATLDVPSAARRGELVRIDAVWTNVSDSSVVFSYSSSLPTNVIVFTLEGEPVWASHDGGLLTGPGMEAALAPGEEVHFTRYWELVDEDGFGLPPGDYLVQARGSGNDRVDGRLRTLSFISATYPLRIEP